MSGFIRLLKEEIINESKPTPEPPRKISLFLTTMKDKYLLKLFNEYTYWAEDPDLGAAMAIAPYDTEHIIIYFNPTELNKMTMDQVRFTLQHEIYHILYEHHSRFKDHISRCPPNLRKVNHNIANICMDAFINQDIIISGGIDGGAVKPPYSVYSFSTEQPPDFGTVEKWMKDSLSDPTLKYTGPGTEFDLYDWVVSLLKNMTPTLPPPPPGGNQGDPGDGEGQGEGEGEGEGSGDGSSGGKSKKNNGGDIKPGDVVQDMDTKDWGKVSSVDPDGTVHYDPMTPQEVDFERSKGARLQRNPMSVLNSPVVRYPVNRSIIRNTRYRDAGEDLV